MDLVEDFTVNVPLLVGGFKYLLFSPLVGEMSQID